MSIWKIFKHKLIIGNGTYGPVYKALDSNTHVAIKEIDKLKYKKINNLNFNENEILKKDNSTENYQCEHHNFKGSIRFHQINPKYELFFKDIIETKEKYYIIMDLCSCNLEDYLNVINASLSIDEIREILIQLNEILKITEKENIIFKDLKPSNILITFSKIDEIKIKICKINTNELSDEIKLNRMEKNYLTIAPEILNEESISKKSDLWSLGIIIYYMLFKEYPYNGEIEYQNQINSNKRLKNIDDEELKDLINRMLKVNENERITWDNYFNHNFFKKDFHNNQLIKQYNQIKSGNPKINDEKIVIYNNDKLNIVSKI